MNIIKNNPYRTVGLLVGASAREQQRQVKRLKQFIEAEQEPQDDFSFPFIGQLHRSVDSVTDAESKLNLDSDRITAGLFWFWNGNPIIDEAAFDSLKEGDTETAYQIWEKLTVETKDDGKRVWKNVTAKNCSAFHNSSVLSLITNQGPFVSAVVANIKFIESDHFEKFVKDAVDETYIVSKKEIQLTFLNNIFETLDNKKLADLVKYLKDYDFAAKTDFQKLFIQRPIEQIEQKIEVAKAKRKSNKSNALIGGQGLFTSTAQELTQLKSIVGPSDIRYTSIADKVANEILQCSIDSFTDGEEKDHYTDYVAPAINLAKQARTVAVGNVTTERIKENIDTLIEIRDKELLQATMLLQSVKDAYEKNEVEIRRQIKELEATDIEIRLGKKSINHRAVEDNIRNSIDWQKVNELIVTVMSNKDLMKMKESDNHSLKWEFLTLANWLKEFSLKSAPISTIIKSYKQIPPKLPFRLISSIITNTDNKPLYTKFIRYIGLDLNVKVIDEKPVTLYIKYIKPDGSINRNDKISPKGYSQVVSQELNRVTKSINLPGWGNSDQCIYEVGEHRIEVYVDEHLIHTKKFVVDLAPSDKLKIKLKKAEIKLAELNNTLFFKPEITSAQNEMAQIKTWKFLRSQSERERQINYQQQKIDKLVHDANQEKAWEVNKQQTIINEIKSKIQEAEY